MGMKVHIIPKSIQSASNELTLTFQLYRGILLRVGGMNFFAGSVNEGSLQKCELLACDEQPLYVDA